MATNAKQTEVEEEEKIRVSITIDPPLRRKMRIAAAYADMEVGEWAAEVLKAAAIKQVRQ
jgi:hypothetical protein